MRPTTTSPGASTSKLHIDLPERPGSGVGDEMLPPLAALFLIYFDLKAGYTIKWKRTAGDVDLDGVEFKSLPSGLHNLKEDLVYFVHEKHAGVSAFINVPAEESQRGALMLSVGVLVPLSYGRLGRGWRHAEGLKALARQFSTDPTTTAPFDEYYERYQVQDGEFPPTTPMSRRSTINSRLGKDRRHWRTNSVSESTIITPGQTLSQHHPALSLSEFMDTFGPLIFPIYRAALARKRILIITHAPVERACNFVYDISILSNIPLSVSDLLPCEPSRLKPLFSVGVHDIPMLEAEAKIRQELADSGVAEGERGAFVACTTDEILAMKTRLYDVLIRLPPKHSKNATEKVWPTVEYPAGTPLRATQRDLRRYRALKQSLYRRYHRNSRLFLDDDSTLAPASPPPDDDEADEPTNIESVCEKLTWREIAYSSFIWWASAGERRSSEEFDDGRLLLDTHFAYTPTTTTTPGLKLPRAGGNSNGNSNGYHDSDSDGGNTEDDAAPRWEAITTPAVATASSSATAAVATPPSGSRRRHRSQSIRRRSTNLMPVGVGGAEMDLIAYFHRFTQRIVTVLAETSSSHCPEDEETALVENGAGSRNGSREYGGYSGDEKGYLSLEEIRQMGLDQYSEVDAGMVEDVNRRWFGRGIEVEQWRVSCCGVDCG